MPGRKPTWTDEAMRQAVASSRSIRGVLRALGLAPLGGNYRTVHGAIARLGLDTSHFTGKGWCRGRRLPVAPPRPLHELLVAGMLTPNPRLKGRLIAAGLLPNLCSECGVKDWRGMPLALELDHVNGDHTDNRIGNLRPLCPNCHSQTPTYRGRNIGKVPLRVRERPRWRNRYTRDT